MIEDGLEDEAVYDINVEVTAVLGVATLLVNQLLKLGRGAVVELGQNVGDPVDLRINNRLIGRGEVVVVEDRLAISITEMVQANK
ncbi:MAG: Flagellar motor switch protein FliN [Alphaproteobacteria bacterium MarineAlpha4_Bin2]|nr:MAG: Flagellar motor switch protein FliN [Alphaproteobacteria bacterium MarineAlpha4_Bin2]